MFQCIIQQRNGWIHPINADTKDVFPGNSIWKLPPAGAAAASNPRNAQCSLGTAITR
ncbi:unnamed protein product [Trichogramma brassicae]|uniref:Uncharacterized protein n=1 Tax=Trichogramma brassicae TaxID=86971 RepID=A0A6H5I681_9HYME|nr:unnamed protein product [Trichogramma brassicae]